MKKIVLSAALAATFGAAALFSTSVAASDGTITITGKVVANTCSFSVNGGSASSTVQLPVVFTTALNAAGAVAGNTPFTIKVSGCDPNLTSVQEQFGGSNINATDGNLKNIATATSPQTVAGNVEVQLLNGTTNTVINLNNNNASPVGTLSSGGVTLNYQAQYYATAAATAGLVNTTVTYTTQYQ
ncbi:fimbrial protein [Dyella nitratireducens]|uniref:Fimbrial protein n=1 Tax=Dyella nitratireducens TaxID=1849580 RepID=A0ABQ1FRH1_9GAMM|nr:fimbrial protein [Dyella nitratireducens]GGA26430.1 fimbrial protein [Dyella nitratireducens]GLQ43550.1 fimbrial protein [Dyella nitratireducens]